MNFKSRFSLKRQNEKKHFNPIALLLGVKRGKGGLSFPPQAEAFAPVVTSS